MAIPPKTPGVYVNEVDAFPNSVVEVATAVPAFVGYTAVAQDGTTNLTNIPTRINSMAEYLALYSASAEQPPVPPEPSIAGTIDYREGSASELVSNNNYLLYRALQLFYANGGGTCWIVSIGPYATTPPAVTDIVNGIHELEGELEPTMIVTPDAAKLNGSDWEKVKTAALEQCTKLKSRIVLLDIVGGDQQPMPSAPDDPISQFRTRVGEPVLERDLSYAVAYWPWLNTSVIEASEVSYTALAPAALSNLDEDLTAEATAAAAPLDPPAALTAAIAAVKTGGKNQDPAQIAQTHQLLIAASPIYQNMMTGALAAANVMPPSSALAGVYTAVDAQVGVWKAPANLSLNSVNSPFVDISSEEQEDLNVPIDGKAVNAIRTFLNRGTLVWGARTLDGNSQDWRYINVRRTMIMLEHSIQQACEPYFFAPNTSATWVTVTAMIENFLNNQWKAGALAGSKPADAYQVSVGLGSTMTADDILNGYMRVSVKVAMSHPAEFIMLTFEQKMQQS